MSSVDGIESLSKASYFSRYCNFVSKSKAVESRDARLCCAGISVSRWLNGRAVQYQPLYTASATSANAPRPILLNLPISTRIVVWSVMERLERSYEQASSYPRNLVDSPVPPVYRDSLLQEIRSQSSRLFCRRESDATVDFLVRAAGRKGAFDNALH